MANSILTAEQWVSTLDGIYQLGALTSVLDSPMEFIDQGQGVKGFRIPKLSMSGLGNYNRASGYPVGDVNLTWELHAPDYDRGRKFTVDAMDNAETRDVAFGQLSGEFIRTKVIPELDAYRLSRYAGLAANSATGSLSTGDGVIAAIRAGVETMDEAEVPAEERYLFITPTLRGLVQDLDTTKSKEVLNGFSQVISVPQTRLYTAISLYDGTSSGETDGGYVKYPTHYQESTAGTAGALKVVADTATPTTGEIKLSAVTPVIGDYEPAADDYVLAVAGKNVNFLIAHKPAVIQGIKHQKPKIILADSNPDADGDIFGYRIYGIADALELKLSGLYMHKAS